jgi:competence protein ComEC
VSSTASLPVQTPGLSLRPLISTVPAAVEARLIAERDQLIHWAPVALGTGIGLWFALGWSSDRWLAAALATTIALVGLAARDLTRRMIVGAALLTLLGMGTAAWRSERVAAPRLLDARTLGVLGGEAVAVERRAGRGQVRITVAPDDQAWPPRVRVNLDAASAPSGLAPGARIEVRVRVSPPPAAAYPGGYDFARNAWFDGIGATGVAMGPVRLTAPAPPPSGAAAGLAALRAQLTARVQTAMPGSAGAIAAAFVTGDQGAITPDVAAAMRDAGLAHLLSISGLHIAVVVAGTMLLVRKALLLSPWIALRWPVKAIAAAAAALAGIGYTLLAGAEVPMVRACIAALIVLAGMIAGREAVTLRLVAIAAFIILMVRPEALLSPSFQLSFAAVTGLVALYQSRIGRWLARRDRYAGWIVRGGRAILAVLLTGLVAEAMLAVPALYHFNRAGVYGVFANLVAIPLTSFVIMPVLVLALIFDALGAGAPVFWVMGHAIDLLIGLARVVAAWPGAVARLPAMPAAAYLLMVVGGLWLCLWRTGWRGAGGVPLVLGAAFALLAAPPDLLVSSDGRQVALVTGDGRMAVLRPRGGNFLRTSWGDATASTDFMAIADLPHAACSRDACVADTGPPGRTTRVLMLLTAPGHARATFAAACSNADIVVSADIVPHWCAPRWLRLDHASLRATGALAIHTASRRIESVAARSGDHPWATPVYALAPDGADSRE